MKKLLIAVGVSALLMGTTALANGLPPSPPVEVEKDNGAIVVNNDGMGSCYMQMRVPGLNYPLFYFGTDVHVVSNKNMTKVICKLDPPEWIDLDKPIKTSELRCMVYSYDLGQPVRATNSKFIWTPGDQARLECTYKAPKEED